MKVHRLKTWPEYFAEVLAGRKRFELRRDDRGFELGDWLELEEYIPIDRPDFHTGYTGRRIGAKIVGVYRPISFRLEPGYVLLAIEPARAAGISGELLERRRAAGRRIVEMMEFGDGFELGGVQFRRNSELRDCYGGDPHGEDRFFAPAELADLWARGVPFTIAALELGEAAIDTASAEMIDLNLWYNGFDPEAVGARGLAAIAQIKAGESAPFSAERRRSIERSAGWHPDDDKPG